MGRLAPAIAHESARGFAWWDEALMVAIPIAVAVLVVLWIARRGRAGSTDED